MLEVVQAFDRALIETDDATALERKLQTAESAFKDRDGWLKPYQRIAIFRKLAVLMEGKRDRFAMQIAREGGKPRLTPSSRPIAPSTVSTMPPTDCAISLAGHSNGAFGRGGEPMGLHDQGTYRHCRDDFGLQSPPKPDRSSVCTSHRGRLPCGARAFFRTAMNWPKNWRLIDALPSRASSARLK